MLDIDEEVNSLFYLPSGPTGFSHILAQWRNHQNRANALVWQQGNDGLLTTALDGGCLIIQSIGDDNYALRYLWPATCTSDVMPKSAALGVGAKSPLLGYLYRLIQAGGPFGGPCVDTPLTSISGLRRYTWLDSLLPDQARVRFYGCGYAFRHRPLRGERYLVVVAPEGSFIACGAGQADDVATIAEEAAKLIRPFAAEIGDTSFFVRLHGDPIRLRYTPTPGLLGFCAIPRQESLLEVFLCLLGREDFAIICIDNGKTRLVARGESSEIVGAEIFPLETETEETPTPPPSLAPKSVAAAIRKLTSLTPTCREHLASLAYEARGALGMRSVRLLLWQIALAHELGLRSDLSGPIFTIYDLLAETTGIAIDDLPRDRARRSALDWLNRHSPFVYPLGLNRDRWGIRNDWLAKPPLSCMDWLKAKSRAGKP